MSGFDEGSRNKTKIRDSDIQRQVFTDKYGVEIEFPAYYFQDAKFVPHYDNLIIVMAYHIIPMQYEHTVRTIHFGKNNKEDDTVGEFADLYPAAVNKSLIFKL